MLFKMKPDHSVRNEDLNSDWRNKEIKCNASDQNGRNWGIQNFHKSVLNLNHQSKELGWRHYEASGAPKHKIFRDGRG